MQNAVLPNGKIINAKEYDPSIHGKKFYCLYCRTKVIFVNPEHSGRDPFFRAIGCTGSKHKSYCPQRRDTKVFESLKSINKYTTDISKIPEHEKRIIKLDFTNINDTQIKTGQIKEIDFNHPKKKLRHVYNYSNAKDRLIKVLSSLKKIVELLNNDVEKLPKIVLVQNGKQFLVSDIVIDQNKAYDIAHNSKYKNILVVVHGNVKSVIKLPKVTFINFHEYDNLKPFSACVFPAYYNKFTYSADQLVDRKVLILGEIKLNSKTSRPEIIIKSNRQIYIWDD